MLGPRDYGKLGVGAAKLGVVGNEIAGVKDALYHRVASLPYVYRVGLAEFGLDVAVAGSHVSQRAEDVHERDSLRRLADDGGMLGCLGADVAE